MKKSLPRPPIKIENSAKCKHAIADLNIIHSIMGWNLRPMGDFMLITLAHPSLFRNKVTHEWHTLSNYRIIRNARANKSRKNQISPLFFGWVCFCVFQTVIRRNTYSLLLYLYLHFCRLYAPSLSSLQPNSETHPPHAMFVVKRCVFITSESVIPNLFISFEVFKSLSCLFFIEDTSR